MTVPIRRVAAITVGLMGAGIVCGAAAGIAAAGLMVLLAGAMDWLLPASVFAAIAGGLLGMITAPLLSWLFLRRVPFGRMFFWCSFGTVIGAIGWGLVGAVVSCAAAAVVLSATYAFVVVERA